MFLTEHSKRSQLFALGSGWVAATPGGLPQLFSELQQHVVTESLEIPG